MKLEPPDVGCYSLGFKARIVRGNLALQGTSGEGFNESRLVICSPEPGIPSPALPPSHFELRRTSRAPSPPSGERDGVRGRPGSWNERSKNSRKPPLPDPLLHSHGREGEKLGHVFPVSTCEWDFGMRTGPRTSVRRGVAMQQTYVCWQP